MCTVKNLSFSESFISLIATLAFTSFFDDFSHHFCAPVFVSNMSFPLSEPAVAAAAMATPQNVRLDPFSEDNVEQWFISHEAEFANNRIVKPSDKFSLAKVKLPKSITDIYSEELAACRDQANAYDALRSFIIS